ncbi:MAG: hypothetical protein CSA65_00550 [Proteobacteria bacterium]|nr:MAG: hypothetical protein CSB49_00110 [Pseudomonadota bacterium]PIE19965.1 MAG: hypothetical protein CSA65_00550 [Pseudomonadota bacterium]
MKAIESLQFIREVGELSALTLGYNAAVWVGNLIDDEQGTIELQIGHLLGRRIMSHLDLAVEVRGAEHVDELWRQGAEYAVVSTHASYLDWAVILGYFPSPVRFIAKMELAKVPAIGRFLRLRGVLIDRKRGIGAKEAIKNAIVDEIKWPILIFAEGTRSFDGVVQPFKRGGLTLLAEAGQILVPVTILGTHAAVPRGQTVIRRGGRVGLFIDEPVTPKDVPDPQARVDECERRVHARFDRERDTFGPPR